MIQVRWTIYQRIMELSEIEFSVQDFIENENPIYHTNSWVLNNCDDFEPLGNPVWIK